MPTSPHEAGPAVSVLLPVYDGEAYVEHALTSILDQTFEDFEVVCVDDGSTDSSPEILARAAASDGRVRVVRQDNQGIVGALRRGLDEARAPIVARMDADDVSLPGRFAAQVAAFDDPGVVLVSCNLQTIRPDGRPGTVRDTASSSHLLDWHLLFFNAIGGHSQVMFRRAAAEAAGGYRAEERHVEDYGLWCRLREQGSIHVVPAVLQQRRVHPTSVSRRNLAEQAEHLALVSRSEIDRRLGRTLDLDDVALLQRFWLAGAAHGVGFPRARDARRVTELLDDLIEQHLLLEIEPSRRPGRREALRRDVSDRYRAWARHHVRELRGLLRPVGRQVGRQVVSATPLGRPMARWLR